jgi:hypothetical protein
MENAAQGHTTVEEEEDIMKNWQMAQVLMDHIIAPRMNSVTY